MARQNRERRRRIKGSLNGTKEISLYLKHHKLEVTVVDLQDNDIVENVAVNGLSLYTKSSYKTAALRYHDPL